MGGGVVNGNEGQGIDDGVLELLHGVRVLCFPDKGFTLSSEVDKGTGDGGVILDPNAHVTH